MKMHRLLMRYFFCLLVFACVPLSFYAQAADKPTNYGMGTACQHDNDCFEGCRTGTEQVNCIHTSEGVKAKIIGVSDPAATNSCVIRTPRPPGGLECYCSPKAHVCGYGISGSGN